MVLLSAKRQQLKFSQSDLVWDLLMDNIKDCKVS